MRGAFFYSFIPSADSSAEESAILNFEPPLRSESLSLVILNFEFH